MTRTITDIKECERAWNAWTSRLGHSGWFDRFDVRLCFYDPSLFTPHFITDGDEDTKGASGAMADAHLGTFLIPLWYDKERELYEQFGGELHEPNHLFFLDKDAMRHAIASLPPWSHLEYVPEADAIDLPFWRMDEHDRYVLEPSTRRITSFEDHLATFSGKHRKNLQRDLRIVETAVTVRKDDAADLSHLAQLNKNRFGPDSSFHSAAEERGFLRMCDLAHTQGKLHTYALAQGAKIIAVQPAILHAGSYIVLSGGADLRVRNCGKLLLALHIKNALALGATLIDFMTHDSGWKTLWNLTPLPQYEYTNEKESEENEKDDQNGGLRP